MHLCIQNHTVRSSVYEEETIDPSQNYGGTCRKLRAIRKPNSPIKAGDLLVGTRPQISGQCQDGDGRVPASGLVHVQYNNCVTSQQLPLTHSCVYALAVQRPAVFQSSWREWMRCDRVSQTFLVLCTPKAPSEIQAKMEFKNLDLK